MPSEETQYKANYDMECVIGRVSEYFLSRDKETIEQTSLRKVYDDVVSENSGIAMPKYSMFRNYLIKTLKAHNLYDESKAEKVNSSVALRLLDIYVGNLEAQLGDYPMRIIEKRVIPCLVPLPDSNVMEQVTQGVQNELGSTIRDRRRTLITKICRNIKSKHRNIIVAAVPESNPLITEKAPNEKINRLSDDENPVFSCQAICLYVIACENGRNFIRSITRENALKKYM